mmetsp:Transcript_24966/g.38177  ORF Transcript_24966/g.38177 Transcript_24966/m.38177 type:complete len:1050 (-) Transcript_24966:54-3203(-)
MTKITQIDDRSAATAWSPVRAYADVIALGAKDTGGVGFEDTGAELELYDLNLSQANSQPMLLGTVKTQGRFSSLGWSAAAMGGQMQAGVLAGGMENGTVHVWNPHAIMTNDGSPLIASYSQHAAGPVKALEFNSLNQTQLATGGSDGKVLISDIEQAENVFTPCANGTHQNTGITSLGWNTQVAHIVASAAADGTVAVWDLRARKSWCELRAETSGLAVSAVAWNPTQGLHLLTASADDRNPVIKLWDLRASTSMPLTSLAGHSQGILSMSWCPHDEHLLLSSGKDNRTILWDLFSLQAIGEVPNDVVQENHDASGGQEMFASGGLASSQQRRYDVQWSPIKRGVASTCSLDRKVQAHSILGLSSKSGRPPKWMRPSSSVSCAFGGSVVSCGSTDNFVRIRTVVEQPELEAVSKAFESTMEATSVIDYCNGRAAKAANADEAQLWSFMQVIFEKNARQSLLDTLGFDPNTIAASAAAYEEDEAVNGVESLSIDDKSGHKQSMSAGTQEVVKQALLVGNFEAAVDCCFRTGNLADGLVLASCGGADLWTKTQERYFQSQSASRPLLSVVNAIIQNELGDLVQKSDPKKWPETLAILSTYGKSEEFPSLCVALGDLLEQAGDSKSATLCYLCALNLSKAVTYWRTQFEEANEKSGGLDLLALHELSIKVSVFLQAAGESAVLEEKDAEIFAKYASKLAEQGLLVTAAKYCRGESQESKLLRDRLYRSKASPSCLAAMGNVPPEFPFDLSDVHSRAKRMAQKAQQKAQENYARQEAHQSASSISYSEQTPASQQNGTSAPVAAEPMAQQPAQDALLPGWMALEDPSSGRYYYANQTTGEVTWDKPQAAPAAQPIAEAPAPTPQAAAVAPTPNATPSRTSHLASKYGDGFVTSASHPELASQYGNVGTSNPYHNTERPGTAKVSGTATEKAPVSATLDLNKITELQPDHYPIRDCLPSLIDALKGTNLSAVDKRLLAESEKAVAVLLKRLARGDISADVGTKMVQMCGLITSYDFRSAQSLQTALVNSDWRDNKDWLKGIKAMLQLATKKFAQ